MYRAAPSLLVGGFGAGNGGMKDKTKQEQSEGCKRELRRNKYDNAFLSGATSTLRHRMV